MACGPVHEQTNHTRQPSSRLLGVREVLRAGPKRGLSLDGSRRLMRGFAGACPGVVHSLLRSTSSSPIWRSRMALDPRTGTSTRPSPSVQREGW